jgi:polyhydroxybutyrate depolymerase
VTARARAVLLLPALLASSACAPLIGARSLRAARPGLTTFHTIRVGRRTRSYLLHLPPAAADGRRVPLVLVFHGHHGNGTVMMDASQMNREADRRGFAVAYPNGTGRLGYVGLTWDAGTCCDYAVDHHVDDIAFADTLVATLVRREGVDSTRVYAAGFSAGGMMAVKLACERAAEFAGVADVAGAMPDTTCRPARPIPVLLIQGTEDDELRRDFVELRRPRHHPFATSLEAALNFWAARNGCGPARVRDSTAAFVRVAASGCAPGRDVELYTVRGNPHAWPGGERIWPLSPKPARHPSASAVILDFFRHG